MKADDPSIDGDEQLYWRAPQLPLDDWTVFDEGREGHRVRRGAFVWNEDGVSCYMHSILAELGLDFHAIKEEPRNGVLSVLAQNVRECDFGVARDPNPDYIPAELLQPRDQAHTLIVHADEVGRKRRNRLTSELARTAQIMHWGEASSEPS